MDCPYCNEEMEDRWEPLRPVPDDDTRGNELRIRPRRGWMRLLWGVHWPGGCDGLVIRYQVFPERSEDFNTAVLFDAPAEEGLLWPRPAGEQPPEV